MGARKELTLYQQIDLTLHLAPRSAEERGLRRLRPDRLMSREFFELRWLRVAVANPELAVEDLDEGTWGLEVVQARSSDSYVICWKGV